MKSYNKFINESIKDHLKPIDRNKVIDNIKNISINNENIYTFLKLLGDTCDTDIEISTLILRKIISSDKWKDMDNNVNLVNAKHIFKHLKGTPEYQNAKYFAEKLFGSTYVDKYMELK